MDAELMWAPSSSGSVPERNKKNKNLSWVRMVAGEIYFFSASAGAQNIQISDVPYMFES